MLRYKGYIKGASHVFQLKRWNAQHQTFSIKHILSKTEQSFMHEFINETVTCQKTAAKQLPFPIPNPRSIKTMIHISLTFKLLWSTFIALFRLHVHLFWSMNKNHVVAESWWELLRVRVAADIFPQNLPGQQKKLLRVSNLSLYSIIILHIHSYAQMK